ncbi:MAG: DUF6273 domain-containing protein [Coriobacteriales bacterium]|nr:DUF6273 domain-containing protein [Coriobacteriales bacterium]
MNAQFGFVASEYAGGVTGPLNLSGYHQTAAGHFAALYRAGEQGQYAIKSFFNTRSDNMARKEYELLSSLNEQGCPSVPRAYGYGTFRDSTGVHPAFVMQYIDGKTLSAIIEDGVLTGDAKNPYLGSRDAARIALGIARALQGIAGVHVAQRDLSPGNVMITNHSLAGLLKGELELYVIDFGQGTPTTRSTITLDNPRLSTVPYGAPEVFGGRHIKERNRELCDVWSLGSLIVTMVSGEYWPAEIVDLKTKAWLSRDDLENIAKAKIRPLNMVERMDVAGRPHDDFEAQLAVIVSACTNYNPNYRPKLRAVIGDLENLLGEPVPVPAPNPILVPDSVTPELEDDVAKRRARTQEARRDVRAGESDDKGKSASVSKMPKPVSPAHNIVVRSGVADYSWVELKRIARAIAAAKDDAEGLRIAGRYHLVDEDGKLRGDEKPLALADGTKTSVRILGFRHDQRAMGGKAGISFEFANVPIGHAMNPERTNKGGWEESEMRKWLNSGFLALMPADIRHLAEPAKKRTNNVGEIETNNDTSVVSETIDRLWLLSVSEVYGKLSSQKKNRPWSSATYDAEGTQYQLYTDKGVSTKSYSSCIKKDNRGADSWWWLRSPYAYSSDSFHIVFSVGVWSIWDADYDDGVSPGFCF